MDFSKFKTSDWLMVGGGGAMLIAGFLPWVTVSVGGFSSASAGPREFFFTGLLPWLIVTAVGVLAALLVMEKIPAGTTPWPLVLLGMAGLGTLLVLIRLIFNPLSGTGSFGVDVGRGFGLILGTIAAIAATVGAVQNFQATGGDLNDLKDINKIKESFSGGDENMAPPPPPPPPPPSSGPSDTPPPPPPPPPPAQ